MNEQNVNTENRLLGAIAHGSIILFGIGILVGVVVYTSQRDKSRYVALQGLQAATFQLIAMIVIIGVWITWTGCYMLSLIPLISQSQSDPNAAPPAIFWIALASMVIPLFIMLLFALYGLWGALRTWEGRDFRYVLIGNWLEKSGLWATN